MSAYRIQPLTLPVPSTYLSILTWILLEAAGAFFFLAIWSADVDDELLPRADNNFKMASVEEEDTAAVGSAGGILLAGTKACDEDIRQVAKNAVGKR